MRHVDMEAMEEAFTHRYSFDEYAKLKQALQIWEEVEETNRRIKSESKITQPPHKKSRTVRNKAVRNKAKPGKPRKAKSRSGKV